MDSSLPSALADGVWKGIRRTGTFHTFDDKRPGFFPLRVLPIDNETASPPQHSHDFYELVFIRKGSGIHTCASNRYPVHAGDCWFIAPGDPEGFEERNNLCLTNVLFYREIFGDRLKDFRDVPGFAQFFSIEPLFRDETRFTHKLHLSVRQQRRAEVYLAALEEELTNEGPGYRLAAAAIFTELSIFVCRCFEAKVSDANAQKEFAGKQQAVDAAMAFLEENYRNDIRLKDVAASVNLSPAWLSDLFRCATGTPIFEYLARFRLDAASVLLRDSPMSVKEISYKVGFHDPAYFSRAFTRAFRIAPSEFRKRATPGSNSTKS